MSFNSPTVPDVPELPDEPLDPDVPDVPDDPAGPGAPDKDTVQLLYVPEPVVDVGFKHKTPVREL